MILPWRYVSIFLIDIWDSKRDTNSISNTSITDEILSLIGQMNRKRNRWRRYRNRSRWRDRRWTLGESLTEELKDEIEQIEDEQLTNYFFFGSRQDVHAAAMRYRNRITHRRLFLSTRRLELKSQNDHAASYERLNTKVIIKKEKSNSCIYHIISIRIKV